MRLVAPKNLTNKVPPEQLFTPPIIILSLLVGVKAIYLALFVTPLWDIPDENGHLAYIIQLADGGGIPIHGEAKIPREIISSSGSKVTSNWISQHPPLYYLLSSIPYWLADQYTTNLDYLWRVPRLVASFCAFILPLVLYRTAKLNGLNETSAIYISGCVSFIPMVTHLSSGVSHDIPLLLVTAFFGHYISRFVLFSNITDAYISAIWLGAACAIKMTAWVVLPIFFIIIFRELLGRLRCMIFHAILVIVISILPACMWIMRNFLIYGNPTYTASSLKSWRLNVPLEHSLGDYLQYQPVIDHFLIHFYGLFGWVGTGGGRVALIQIDGFPLGVFTALLLATSLCISARFACIVLHAKCISYPFYFKLNFLNKSRDYYCIFFKLGSIFATAIIISFILFYSMNSGPLSNIRIVAIASIVALGAGAVFLIPIADRKADRLFLFGLLAFSFFSIVLLYNVFEIYLLKGRLSAIHGRYLFPVIPMIFIALCISLAKYKKSEVALAVAFTFSVVSEVDAYLSQVLPFFGSGT